MKQTIIFEGNTCDQVEAENALPSNEIRSALPVEVMQSPPIPDPSYADSECKGGQFWEGNIMSFDEDCPVCGDVCVKSPIVFTKKTKNRANLTQLVSVSAELRDPVDSECFLKLKIESSSRTGDLYLKVNAGSSQTEALELELDPGSYKIKGNVKEESDS